MGSLVSLIIGIVLGLIIFGLVTAYSKLDEKITELDARVQYLEKARHQQIVNDNGYAPKPPTGGTVMQDH